MAFRCSICLVFFALTLRLLLKHLYLEHAGRPNFHVLCGIEGCPQTYTKYNSFYRHVNREHAGLLNITHEHCDNGGPNGSGEADIFDMEIEGTGGDEHVNGNGEIPQPLRNESDNSDAPPSESDDISDAEVSLTVCYIQWSASYDHPFCQRKGVT